MKYNFVFILITFIILRTHHDAKYYFNKAEVQREKNEWNNAYSNYTKAIRMNVNYYNAYFKRALLLQDMDSTASAIKDFTTAIGIHHTGEAYYYRANAKQKINDSTACADWEQACDYQYNPACDKYSTNCKR